MQQENKLIDNFLKNRSSKNFLVLYRCYANDLMLTAMFLTKYNKELAEDIVQETWATAIKRLHVFKANSLLKTWLTGILLNKYREYQRKQKIVLNTIEIKKVNALHTKHDLSMDIKQAILKLPEGYRTILTLYDIKGFKHKEIGEMLGIDEGTSKSQLSQARKKMRLLLNTYRS